jgi:hypothetical protein
LVLSFGIAALVCFRAGDVRKLERGICFSIRRAATAPVPLAEHSAISCQHSGS